MSRKSSIAIIIFVAAFLVVTTAASAAEIQLGGIKLARSAFSIIQKYGDPSEVRPGGGGGPAMGPMNGSPFGMETPPPGMGTPIETPPPGMGMQPPPGFGPNMGMPQQTQAGGREVIWVYNFAKNKTLEFILDSKGLVLQIAAFGVEWSGMKTAKGITLGDTYKEVILAYGFPESHSISGINMVLRYANSDRVAFTLVGNQVVGITIAFMD